MMKLLDSVFVKLRIIKVLDKISVIGLGSLIVHCTSALIIPHITRIISNNNIAQYKCSLQALGPCTNYKRTL